MEIKRYLEEYRKHSPEEFFNWVSEGKTIEVRFLSDLHGRKFKNYNLIKEISAFVRAEHRYTSIYIKSWKQLENILLYKFLGNPVTRLFNIFIGVNPRRKVYTKSKNGLLKKTYYGGIAGTSHIMNILCDIEHVGERKGNASEEMLEECIQGAKYLVKILELENFYINISGNGVHLWFKLEDPIEIPIPSFTEFPDKVKYNLKEKEVFTLIKTYNRFIEKLDKHIKEYNTNLKVDDGAKDIARIARPTGSWNVKSKKKARAVGTVLKLIKNNKYNNKYFMAAKPKISENNMKFKEKKGRTKNHRYTALTIKEAPLTQLLLSGLLPSTLSRNHYLEQSFARLLRDNEIELHEIQDLISEINEVQQKDIQVDPDYLEDEEPFNPETVNAYCFGSRIDLVYPIMEDIPDIQCDDFVDDKRYNLWDKTSIKSMKKFSYEVKDEVDNYLKLKMLIRFLIDGENPRASIFYTLKLKFIEEWEYFQRNNIIKTLMNKTRRREENEIKSSDKKDFSQK